MASVKEASPFCAVGSDPSWQHLCTVTNELKQVTCFFKLIFVLVWYAIISLINYYGSCLVETITVSHYAGTRSYYFIMLALYIDIDTSLDSGV